MDLDDRQKQELAQWVDDGLGLNEIQTRLRDEFSLALTYMEVRFLIDDLDLEFRKAEPSVPEVEETQEVKEVEAEVMPDPVVGGGVQVTHDRINQPGMLISGSVTFSDGVSANWALDQSGRIALKGAGEGYQPPQEDLAQFQQEISKILQSQGYA